MVRGTSKALVRSESYSGLKEYAPTIAGAGAGAVTAGASWAAVQVAAHASTGAAMAGLHGAAASSAGWAWFGGGSLAARGGGMALRHFVLPGIGTAVAVAVSAGLAHSEANKILKACEELESANNKNTIVLKQVNSDMEATRRVEDKLSHWDKYLADELKAARHQLFRFGILSHIRRILRYLFRGSYYASDDSSCGEGGSCSRESSHTICVTFIPSVVILGFIDRNDTAP